MMQKILVMWIIAISAGAAWSVRASPALGADDPRVAEYRIGPADILTVAVWKNDRLTRTVTVRPDGAISFPLLGDVYVAGLTPNEMQTRMYERLKEFVDVVDSEVSVITEEVHSFKVSVLGEVREPGLYEFTGRTRVLDALAHAGGLTEFASGSRIVVLRQNGGSMERIRFDYNAVKSNGGSQSGLDVRPGDIVLVP